MSVKVGIPKFPWRRATHSCGVFVDYLKISNSTARSLVKEKGFRLPRPGYEMRLESELVLVNLAGSFELRRM